MLPTQVQLRKHSGLKINRPTACLPGMTDSKIGQEEIYN